MTLGFALERLSYYRKRGGNPDATMRKAMNAIEGGRFDEAINHFQDLAHPLGPVATNTLPGFRRAPGEAEEIMHVMLNQQKLLLERNTGLLGTMAAVTPLIGLLGTVWGIMRAFQAMSAAGSAGAGDRGRRRRRGAGDHGGRPGRRRAGGHALQPPEPPPGDDAGGGREPHAPAVRGGARGVGLSPAPAAASAPATRRWRGRRRRRRANPWRWPE